MFQSLLLTLGTSWWGFKACKGDCQLALAITGQKSHPTRASSTRGARWAQKRRALRVRGCVCAESPARGSSSPSAGSFPVMLWKGGLWGQLSLGPDKTTKPRPLFHRAVEKGSVWPQKKMFSLWVLPMSGQSGWPAPRAPPRATFTVQSTPSLGATPMMVRAPFVLSFTFILPVQLTHLPSVLLKARVNLSEWCYDVF